ncbi:MAG: hypothetical protein AB1467_00050 [Candidatus Diapherotrites archaeon]
MKKINPKIKRAGKIGIAIVAGGILYYLNLNKPLTPREQKNVSEYLNKVVIPSPEFRKKFDLVPVDTSTLYAKDTLYGKVLKNSLVALEDTLPRQPLEILSRRKEFIDSLTTYLEAKIRENKQLPHRMRLKPEIYPFLHKGPPQIFRGKSYPYLKGRDGVVFTQKTRWPYQKKVPRHGK